MLTRPCPGESCVFRLNPWRACHHHGTRILPPPLRNSNRCDTAAPSSVCVVWRFRPGGAFWSKYPPWKGRAGEGTEQPLADASPVLCLVRTTNRLPTPVGFPSQNLRWERVLRSEICVTSLSALPKISTPQIFVAWWVTENVECGCQEKCPWKFKDFKGCWEMYSVKVCLSCLSLDSTKWVRRQEGEGGAFIPALANWYPVLLGSQFTPWDSFIHSTNTFPQLQGSLNATVSQARF